MKIKLILACFLAIAMSATAQKKDAASEIYQKLEQEEDVFSISLNKKMLESIDTDLEWGDAMRYVQGDLHRVKVMLINSENSSEKITNYIYKELGKLGYKLTDLPEDGDVDLDDEEIYLFTNKKGKKLSEAHVLIKSNDGGGILLSIYGDLTVTDEKI